MKKIVTGIIITSLIVAFAAMGTFAYGYNRSGNYTDSNGDGICDNRGANGCGRGVNFDDEDGDGLCDNRGANGCGRGRNFADANGDGVCDNYGKRVRPMNGTGNKYGLSQ